MRKHNLIYAIGSSVLILAVPLLVTSLSENASSQQAISPISVRGGGQTIVIGGDGGMVQGAPGLPTPVVTILSFQATKDEEKVQGFFECLALMPRKAESFKPVSGTFSVNVMYVTGTVTGLEIDGDIATLSGKATITGVGAGTDVDFTFVVQQGGPGSFMTLTTEDPETGKPLVFKEQLIEGEVKIAA